MGFAFNPFTGNFDHKGSGGGGSSYIDGEVQNFSALPETVGTPPVDSAYLVREAEGAWLLSRKSAGIYIRTANSGVRANDWTYAGEFPDVFSDDKFVLYDETDSSKNLVFQLSGLPTGTTTTLTVPASGTLARTEDFAAPPAIGSTTPNTGAFTTLTSTINSLATTPTQGLKLQNTTAAANNSQQVSPFLSLAGQGWNTGSSTSQEMEFGLHVLPVQANPPVSELILRHRVAGGSWTNVASFFSGNNTGFTSVLTLTGAYGTSTFRRGGGNDLGIDQNLRVGGGWLRIDQGGGSIAFMHTDANNTFAQRNGSAAQTFRIYTTYGGTGGVDFERLFIKGQTGGAFQIGTEKGGTGSARALEFQTDGVTRLTVGATGNIGIGTTSPSQLLQITGSCDSNAVGPLLVTAQGGNIGTALTLAAATLAGGKTYSFISTGPTASGGAGDFAVYQGTSPNAGYVFRCNTNGQYIAGKNTYTYLGQISCYPFSATTKGLVVKGFASQSANLFECQDSGSTVLASISSAGAGSLVGLTLTGDLTISTKDIVTDTTTGTKIGTATTQKLGFWNATPAVQPAAVADATDAASTQDRLNDLLARLRTIGIIAT